MTSRSAICALIAGLAFTGFSTGGPIGGEAEVWLTNPDKSALFERQKTGLAPYARANGNPTIDVDDKQKFQTIDGFGFALTGGSAQHLVRMEAGRRAALIQELFAADGNNIGVSYLRVSIGASDLNDHVFSYDDLPPGQT